ncbi:restriction endonuclease subunit S [Nitrosomonas sp. wSCUT-2]
MWIEKKLGDLCDVKGGKRLPKGGEFSNKGYPYIRARDIRGGRVTFDQPVYIDEKIRAKLKRYKVKKDDICITIVGINIGDVGIIPVFLDDANLTENAAKLTNYKNTFPPFLNYYLQTQNVWELMQLIASGAAQGKLGLYKIQQVPVPVPDLSVQKKIAAILTAYDELIENNRRRITLLEKMAEEIYREWFVRMRFPGHEKVNKVKGLPEGWKIQKLGQLFNTSSGGTPPRENTSNFNGEICWAKTGELKSTFVLDTEERISQSGIDSSAAKIYPRYTIVIAMYCAMPDISILAVDSATNQACCAFFPKNDYFHYSYSYLLIKFAQKHMINFAHGAAQQNLSQELIKGFPLLTPTKDLITEYSKVAEPIFIQVEQLMKTNTYLRKIRDQLLPRLISGKLSVEHLDIQFPPGMEESACV